MVKILEGKKLGVRKSKSTLNVISQFQFSIEYLELWYATSFRSSKAKYDIKNLIALIAFFWRIFNKNILARFWAIFD